MASDRVVQEIKERLDLVDYVGRSVDLKRAGRTFKACCPFHAEKTPSFVLFPHTGTWHCFGACGEGGDLFSFVQKREGLSFSEALQLLAREAGVTLEEESDHEREARAARERLLALCDAAAQQFQAWLRELPAAEACRDYVAQRGLSEATRFRFALGYAPDSWDALLTALTARGYSPQEMAEVGLARPREGGGFYDWLRERLIFPIRDVRGRTIAFGGRALHAEQQPKYINSPQTPLFDKGRTLYALELAKDAIRSEGRAVVVEGYMDAIAAHQAGHANVVATLGTALTAEQIRLLGRYSPNVVLALDADAAGQRAAERGLEAILDSQRQARHSRWEKARQGRAATSEAEGDVRLLMLPPGMDPDDLLRQAPEQWPTLVAAAQPVMDFLITRRTAEADLNDPVQKARVAAELLPLVGELDSTLVRDHYLQRLARLLRTDERTLAQEMVRLGPRREATPRRSEGPPAARHPAGPPLPDEPPPTDEWGLPVDESFDFWPTEGDSAAPPAPPNEAARGPTSSPVSRESYLLFLLLDRPAFLPQAVEAGLRPECWREAPERALFEALLRQPPASAAHLEEFLEELERPLAATVRALMAAFDAQPPIEPEEWEREALIAVDHLLIDFESRQTRNLHYLLDDLQRDDAPDRPQIETLLAQQLTVERRRLHLQRRLQKRLDGQGKVAASR